MGAAMAKNRAGHSLSASTVVAFALSLSACSSAAELRMAGNPGTAAGMRVEDVPLNAPLSFGAVMLCISSPGTATIRSIAVHQATGDIEVQAFATRPNPFTRGLDGLGSQRSTIADLHLDFAPAAPATVSGVCPDDAASVAPSISAQLVELAVQVARRSGDAAGGSALDVTYEVGGDMRSAVIPFGVWLCAATCPPEAGKLYQP
jgi:hypothetical protein